MLMEKLSPLQLMIIGTVLMLTGVCLPLMMVVKVLTATYTLSFLSYAASLAGMVLAFLGLFSYVGVKRRCRKDQDQPNWYDQH